MTELNRALILGEVPPRRSLSELGRGRHRVLLLRPDDVVGVNLTPRARRLLIFLAAVALVAGFALGRLFDHTRGYLP